MNLPIDGCLPLEKCHDLQKIILGSFRIKSDWNKEEARWNKGLEPFPMLYRTVVDRGFVPAVERIS